MKVSCHGTFNLETLNLSKKLWNMIILVIITVSYSILYICIILNLGYCFS